MMGPGFVVHALGDLNKRIQIVRAQVELSRRTPEEKAAVGPQLSFRIFAPMPAYFTGGGLDAHRNGAVRAVNEPDEDVAGALRQRAIDRRGHSDGTAELTDGLFRRGADRDDTGHGFEG